MTLDLKKFKQALGAFMNVSSMVAVAGVVVFLFFTKVALSQQQQATTPTTSKQQVTVKGENSADKSNKTGKQSKSPTEGRDQATQQASLTKSTAYCDIITLNRGLGWVQGVNYSTFRMGPCDVRSIELLTAASARAQMATIGSYDDLIVTGPYYYTMDVNATQVENPYIALGNLRFAEISRSEFTFFDLLRRPDEAWRWFKGETTYNPILTTGDVDLIWFAGTKIYVLESNHGEFFVMSGVDHEIAFGQNDVRLKNLGRYLNLPDGWSFRIMQLNRVLSLNSRVLVNTKFDRLIDEFGNLYIQLPISTDLTKIADPSE